MKKLIACLAFVPCVAVAQPAKIPPLAVCANAAGVVSVKKKCAKNEARLTLGALAVKGDQGTVGPQGPQGPAGAAGSFDVSKCAKREQAASGFSGVLAAVSCLTDEFVVSSGCYVTDGPGTVISQKLSTGANAKHPTAYGILSCAGFDPIGSGLAFTITAQVFCCRQ